MSLYESYLEEIEERKAMGLNPKPIDDKALANAVSYTHLTLPTKA